MIRIIPVENETFAGDAVDVCLGACYYLFNVGAVE
jgi:hypothetical protein